MEKYTFVEKLGRGTHGTVYLLRTNSSFVVCKSVPEKHAKYANREIDFLLNLCHRRIIKMLEHVRIDSCYYLILEYANGGTLENIILQKKKQGIDQNYFRLVWNMVAQLVDALSYLHSKSIIHRDIKPTNVLVNRLKYREDEIVEFKLCDFSLSTKVGVSMGSVVGTPFYMAPEIINKVDYNEKVDMWSLGVLIYETVTLQRPFNGKTRRDLQRSIVEDEVPDIPNLEPESLLLDLIISCLCKNSEERITSHEVRRMDRIRYSLAVNEIRMRDWRIGVLEDKIKELEGVTIRTPESSSRKSM